MKNILLSMHTCWLTFQRLTWHSIPRPLHITPRRDSVLIDVSIRSNVIRGVAGFSHITVTDNEIPPPTSDVVHLHTVDNVWINTSEVQGKWRLPSDSNVNVGSPSEISYRSQWS